MADNKIIGFVGSDKYEIILYLSRILYHLQKRVLLVDFSETRALTQSIPIPNLLRERDIYLEYRGVDFVRGGGYQVDMEKEYDYVFLDFGYNHNLLNSITCDSIVYVTDLQFHNAKRLNITNKHEGSHKYIVIKDVFMCKVTPDYILSELNQGATIKNVYIIEQDILDIKIKTNSQYSQKFNFEKLSKSMKTFLKDILIEFDANIDKIQIQSAYKKAERGV
ncbi:MAG: hypothetical protein GX323_00350 [Clostridiales bacterium]|nr:hypothetical protein [Clostridiales bacterium]